MATDVQIGGTGEVGKVRNPLAPIGLSIITLGIYGLVWYYKVNKELAAIGKSKGSDRCGDNPMMSLIAVTIGACVIIPAVVSMWNTWQRAQAASELTGAKPAISPVGGFILMYILGIGYFLLQSSMNSILEAQAGAVAPVAAPMAA